MTQRLSAPFSAQPKQGRLRASLIRPQQLQPITSNIPTATGAAYTFMCQDLAGTCCKRRSLPFISWEVRDAFADVLKPHGT